MVFYKYVSTWTYFSSINLMFCTRGADSAPPPSTIPDHLKWKYHNMASGQLLTSLIIKQHYETISLVLREYGGD